MNYRFKQRKSKGEKLSFDKFIISSMDDEGNFYYFLDMFYWLYITARYNFYLFFFQHHGIICFSCPRDWEVRS